MSLPGLLFATVSVFGAGSALVFCVSLAIIFPELSRLMTSRNATRQACPSGRCPYLPSTRQTGASTPPAIYGLVLSRSIAFDISPDAPPPAPGLRTVKLAWAAERSLGAGDSGQPAPPRKGCLG